MVGGVFEDVKSLHLQQLGFVIGKNIEMVRNDEKNTVSILPNLLN